MTAKVKWIGEAVIIRDISGNRHGPYLVLEKDDTGLTLETGGGRTEIMPWTTIMWARKVEA